MKRDGEIHKYRVTIIKECILTTPYINGIIIILYIIYIYIYS